MDFERTRKYFDDLKKQYPNTPIKYEELGDEIEFHRWAKRCKDSSGDWIQDPKHPEITYPIKTVWAIIREMTREGEKLKSRQTWTGLNAYLDPQTNSVIDPETYIETNFTKRRVPDPNNRDNIITEPSGVGVQVKRYTLDYTPENVDKLLEMSDGGAVALSVNDTRRAVHPREVISAQDFRDRKFDELINPTISPAANETSRAKR